MEEKEKFSFKDRIRSFGYAFNGLKILFRFEHNAWIHSIITFVVIILGFLLKISSVEWVGVLLCIGMVLAAEAFNSSIEKIMNRLIPQYDEQVKQVKDMAAAGVLITAIIAVIVGLVIFSPKIIALF